MAKKKVKENLIANLNIAETAINPWDTAISDAERKIQEARARVRRLRGAILHFRDMRDSGEAFPVVDSEQSEAKT
jgi:hypothetical protein